ncbi:MAG: DMT family transporter [Burkholderiales bacterium]|nr:DMT family transporter [Burkholderiales bacterium]
MRSRDLAELMLLGALWGASFPFMRVAAPELSPLPLIELRLGLAALVLLPIIAMRTGLSAFRPVWRPIAFVGVANSMLPFCLFAFAALHLTSGMLAILNATAPLWTAIIAWAWLREKLNGWRVAGLLVGFLGVALLMGDRAAMKTDMAAWAMLACLAAALCYGVAGNYTRRRLTGVDPLLVAAGSQAAAALVLLPFALATWPASAVSAKAWMATVALALASTALAYALYFRLIARLGISRAITVTYLIPAFGMLWGNLFLAEPFTAPMLGGCAVILVGIALATGMLGPREATHVASAAKAPGADRTRG